MRLLSRKRKKVAVEEMKEPDSVLAPASVPKYEKTPCHIRVTWGFWLGL